MTAPDLSWRRRGACAGDPDAMDAMFPEGVGVYVTNAYRTAAARWCHGCPVRLECLRYGVAAERTEAGRHGVWGGLSPVERANPELVATRLALLEGQRARRRVVMAVGGEGGT